MKIIFKDNTQEPFSELYPGDFFRLMPNGSIIYMKLKRNEEDIFNTVDLDNGELITLKPYERVFPLDGTFIYKEKN